MDNVITGKNTEPTMRTETMAQLLLSQGHWQQAREIYQEIYDQDTQKHAHLGEILADIDREYTSQQPAKPDQTTIVKAQLDYLNSFLKLVRKEL